MLQCVATDCQYCLGIKCMSHVSRRHAATHCNTLQHTAMCCNVVQHTATQRYVLQCVVCCSLWCRDGHEHGIKRLSDASLQHAATHCNILQHAATCCNTQECVAACCNRLLVLLLQQMQESRFTATRCNTLQHGCCNTAAATQLLQHNCCNTAAATYCCNTLLHSATHMRVWHDNQCVSHASLQHAETRCNKPNKLQQKCACCSVLWCHPQPRAHACVCTCVCVRYMYICIII